MRIPAPPPPQPGVTRRTIARAHTVDALWTRLLLDTEFAPAPMRPVVRSVVHHAAERHLLVRCRRHVASVRRLLAADFPPYRVLAATVAHP